MALLTVTPNPALDKMYVVPGFAPGAVFKATETYAAAGGKGVNVARVAHALGASVTATGFLGGVAGEQVRRSLVREGIPASFVSVGGETRTSTVIADPASRKDTVVNEAGPDIAAPEYDALWARLRELLPTVQTVSLSGSLPPGVPSRFYAEVIETARRLGVRAALDASGEALTLGANAGPFLLKPNTQELAALSVGGDGWASSAQALRAVYGAEVALVTDGARGAALACADGLWACLPPAVEVKSAVGSGDSFLAAFLWAWDAGQGPEEAFKLGTAAGAANARHYGSGFCTRAEVFELAARTFPRRLA